MNWRHRPPRSTAEVFRFLFAMSIFIFRFLFAAVHSPPHLAFPPITRPTCLSPAHERLPRAPVGVILLFPEYRGAHRKESHAYPALSTDFGIRRHTSDSRTRRNRPARHEAT